MTRDELFEKLKKHGFDMRRDTKVLGDFYYIFYKKLCCARLFPSLDFDKTFILAGGFTDLERNKKEVLYKALTEYAATPIEERNPKRYFQYRLKPIAGNKTSADLLVFWGYLGFKKCTNRFSLGTQYEDIDEGWRTIFEENDPLLNEVNLEMFEAIEVDAEGNEIKK